MARCSRSSPVDQLQTVSKVLREQQRLPLVFYAFFVWGAVFYTELALTRYLTRTLCSRYQSSGVKSYGWNLYPVI
ncbi:hypothetical protein HPB50_024656 [Hyalomma asiaticum]|uniref:Uncharacterized protein n=1 Tax=Hyalomma asiaticum TaxID=266040 RepID=A0ACB7SP34_HYAAI|nr:hypothetical protein HPB50_024656 [Hyalomma asiaticum]